MEKCEYKLPLNNGEVFHKINSQRPDCSHTVNINKFQSSVLNQCLNGHTFVYCRHC